MAYRLKDEAKDAAEASQSSNSPMAAFDQFGGVQVRDHASIRGSTAEPLTSHQDGPILGFTFWHLAIISCPRAAVLCVCRTT